jgi:hypothetical protein
VGGEGAFILLTKENGDRVFRASVDCFIRSLQSRYNCRDSIKIFLLYFFFVVKGEKESFFLIK